MSGMTVHSLCSLGEKINHDDFLIRQFYIHHNYWKLFAVNTNCNINEYPKIYLIKPKFKLNNKVN